MPAMKSKGQAMYDADPSVVLRALGSAPITAATNTNVLALGRNTPQAYWDNNENTNRQPLEVIVAASVAAAGAGISYTVVVEVGVSAAFTAPQIVARTVYTTPGQYVLPVNVDTVREALGSTYTHIRATITPAGAGASTVAGVYLSISGQ